jgi:hypothetical protein
MRASVKKSQTFLCGLTLGLKDGVMRAELFERLAGVGGSCRIDVAPVTFRSVPVFGFLVCRCSKILEAVVLELVQAVEGRDGIAD